MVLNTEIDQGKGNVFLITINITLITTGVVIILIKLMLVIKILALKGMMHFLHRYNVNIMTYRRIIIT